MSDETTRARLLTIGSLEWALNLPKCADDDVSRVIAYRKEIEAQCTQAAKHAETVARLEQALATLRTDVATLLRGFDEGVFVRDVSQDGDPSWAVKLLPFILAIQRLAAAPDGDVTP